MLDVLSEAKIPIAGLAGSSVGALAAATFAYGMAVNPEDLSDWLKDPELERLQKTGALHLVSRMLDFVRRPYLAEGRKLHQGYRTLFGDRRIEDSPIPLIIQACDFYTGEVVMLRSGLVSEALVASSAVPGIFPPVQWQGRLLVDGDVAEMVPVTAAKTLEAGPIVAVDVSNRTMSREPKSALEAVLQAGEASRRRLLSMALSQADLVITLAADPPIETFDYTKVSLAYQLGRKRVEEELPRIMQLLEHRARRGLLGQTPSWWSRLLYPKGQSDKSSQIPGQPQAHKSQTPKA